MRTIVLADLHLVRHTPRAVVDDVVRLVREHAGARIVFAGDLFDLSADPEAGVAAHSELRTTLARHVDTGGELVLVAGNHDAALGAPDARARVADELGLEPSAHGARARVRTTPWFFRDGGLHVEHGHLHDPDNATAHPLVAGPSLGVHFVERFIVPTGAHEYLNANDGTPLAMFLSSFRLYGLRAPYVVYRFFRAAFEALRKSGGAFAAERARAEGDARLDGFALAAGVDREELACLASLAARPTLASTRATFARMYLDRVAATLAIAGGATALACASATSVTGLAGAAAAAGGGAAMVTSWARGHDRYGGGVVERLARAAARVVDSGRAKLVVFGHTHVEALGSSYANTGSFSFARGSAGRPFVEIEGDLASPRAVRRYVRRTPTRRSSG